jgi:integrase
LFTGWKGWTVDNASRGVLFCKACRRAKIKNLHFHDARAEALTLMARRGIDILTLARISGHRDINMLQRYYRETTEAIALRLG